MNPNFHTNVTPGETARYFGVCVKTLRNWEKEGKIKCIRGPHNVRYYDITSVREFANYQQPPESGKKLIYARVSSAKQKGDLERQVQSLLEKFPGYEVIQDIGSGINWKRSGLRSLLQQCMARKVQEVVIAHRDRLSRLAFELIEFIITSSGAKLLVQDSNESSKTPNEELGEDLLSIMHIFSCREYGKRKYKKGGTKKEKTKEVGKSKGKRKSDQMS